MAAKELGTKHVCFKCGTRFYDLRKPEPLCPKCGADQRESPVVKAPPAERRSKGSRAAVPPPPPAEPAEVDPEEAETDEDEDDEDEDDDEA